MEVNITLAFKVTRYQEFDDGLPKRKFDNFQFVPFSATMDKAENREVTFSVAALQEIPEQFYCIKKLGYLDR
jgi:E3 ubiquitin-protein ligase RGLG